MDAFILGPVEAGCPRHGLQPSAPTVPAVRQTLALLLLRAGHLTPVATLVDELWGPNPPRSAGRLAQHYVYLLRRFLAGGGLIADGCAGLCTRSGGYVLELGDGTLDATAFRDDVRAAQTRLLADDPGAATRHAGQALARWSGPVLSDVRQGQLLRAEAVALEELRTRALEVRIEAELHLGRHRDLVPELRGLVVSHPLHEWLYVKLMTALSRSGRRGEAVLAYRQLAGVLDVELGLPPERETRELHERLLEGQAI